MCQPRIQGTVGAEPFSAKIRYTGSDDPDFPNLIKLTINMPHMDGEHIMSLYSMSSMSFDRQPAFYCLIIIHDKNICFPSNRHAAGDLHKTSVKL